MDSALAGPRPVEPSPATAMTLEQRAKGLSLDVDALWAEADALGPAEPEPPAEEEGE
jgi:hypothetical protein